jgi:hypothetical protein
MRAENRSLGVFLAATVVLGFPLGLGCDAKGKAQAPDGAVLSSASTLTSRPLAAASAPSTVSIVSSAHAEDASDSNLFEPYSEALTTERYQRAAEGEPPELLRLIAAEGVDNLLEVIQAPSGKRTAIAVAAFEFSGALRALPALADLALRDSDQATGALLAAHSVASEVRQAVDPEDGAELRAGCEALSALLRSEKATRRNRMIALGTLRMLAERGCAMPVEIPGGF